MILRGIFCGSISSGIWSSHSMSIWSEAFILNEIFLFFSVYKNVCKTAFKTASVHSVGKRCNIFVKTFAARVVRGNFCRKIRHYSDNSPLFCGCGGSSGGGSSKGGGSTGGSKTGYTGVTVMADSFSSALRRLLLLLIILFIIKSAIPITQLIPSDIPKNFKLLFRSK